MIDTERESIIKLAESMFDLAPDSTTENLLESMYNSSGQSLSGLANNLANTDLFKSKIGSLDDINNEVSYLMDSFDLKDGTEAGTLAKNFFQNELHNGKAIGDIYAEAVEYLSSDAKLSIFNDTAKMLDNKYNVAQDFIKSGVKAKDISDLDIISNVTSDDKTVSDTIKFIEEKFNINIDDSIKDIVEDYIDNNDIKSVGIPDNDSIPDNIHI